MTPNDRIDGRLTAGLTDLVGSSAPDYRNDILRQVARTRQRPAWTFPDRWIPVTLTAHRGASSRLRAPARPMRQTWLLLIIAAITLALVAGLAVGAARLLLPPDRGLKGLASAPVLELEATWDASTIPGLEYPLGIDLGPDGNLYVVNAGTSEILVIDPAGHVVRRWGEHGNGDGQFAFHRDVSDAWDNIGGVAVAADGTVYVADAMNGRVQRFMPDGTYLGQWGGYGPGNGQFLEPFGIAAGPDGSVYVVDDRRDDVQRFAADGTWQATVGSHGTGDGQLNNSGGIAVGAHDTLFNADWGNQRVQTWDPHGAFVRSFASPHPDGEFVPTDVGVDTAGSMYVTVGDGLRLLGPAGDERAAWVDPSVGDPGDAYFVAVPPDGSLAYVAAMISSKIQRLSVGSRQVEASPAPRQSIPPSPSPLVGSVAPVATMSPAPTDTVLAVEMPFPIPFTLDLPSRWSFNGSARGYADTVLRRDADNTPAYVTVYIPTNAFADPCKAAGGPMSPPIGPSVDDLTQALTQAAGMRAGLVTDVAIDGYHGKAFDLDNNIDISACSDNPWLRQWTYDSSKDGAVVEEDKVGLSGSHQRIAILDVRGTRVMVVAWTIGSLRDEVAEAWHVMDSIHFPVPQPSVGPSPEPTR